MEIFRVTRDVYGQSQIVGVSWDLLWVFVGVSVAFVVLHILYMWLRAPRRRRH